MRTYLAIAFFLLSVPARAEEDCNKAVNQNELNTCAEDNYAAADKALNEAWGKLTSATRAKLRGEERDWIAAREKACRGEASESEGGSIYPLLYFGCMAEKTKARTKALLAASR